MQHEHNQQISVSGWVESRLSTTTDITPPRPQGSRPPSIAERKKPKTRETMAKEAIEDTTWFSWTSCLRKPQVPYRSPDRSRGRKVHAKSISSQAHEQITRQQAKMTKMKKGTTRSVSKPTDNRVLSMQLLPHPEGTPNQGNRGTRFERESDKAQ